MERYTHKDAENVVKRLAGLYGKSLSNDGEYIVGTWGLGTRTGGYVVQEIVNDSGAVRCVFGRRGRPAREFVEMAEVVEEALREAERTAEREGILKIEKEG